MESEKVIEKNILFALLQSALKQGFITETEYRRMLTLANKK